MSGLVNSLIKEGVLKSDSVIEALSHVDRIEFVPPELEQQSHVNIPLPIGYGQTISQPQTVAIMLELVGAKEGEKVLDVGSGSGWTTALLSHIVGEKGKVIAIDRIKSLVETGRENADKFGFVKKGIAHFVQGDGSKGYEKEAPFDCILVSAMAEKVPEELKKQLKIGGRMIIPIYNSLWLLKKISKTEFEIEKFPGFAFVPLVEDK